MTDTIALTAAFKAGEAAALRGKDHLGCIAHKGKAYDFYIAGWKRGKAAWDAAAPARAKEHEAAQAATREIIAMLNDAALDIALADLADKRRASRRIDEMSNAAEAAANR